MNFFLNGWCTIFGQWQKRYNNLFTDKTCYQTSKIGSDPPVLAGWSVARFLRLYQCSLGITQ